jgi:hypothetical protein
MSVQGIAGPRLDLDGPPPVAPAFSLLNTPGVVVDGNVGGDPDDTGRWLNGVNFIGYPSSVPLTWNACDPHVTGSAIKEEGDTGPRSQFDPFVCYLPVTCSSLNYAVLAEWSETVLEATYSFPVEEALVGKVAAGLTPNPALGDSNVTILGGGAKNPVAALAYLENAIGATGRRGMIHASPAIVAALGMDKLDGADVFDKDGDPPRLITFNGTPVVSGGGYAGASANGVPPGTGKDYMFASGPVQVRVSPMAITDLSQSLDRSDNTITFRAERWVLVSWDTALQAAVLVDWAS